MTEEQFVKMVRSEATAVARSMKQAADKVLPLPVALAKASGSGQAIVSLIDEARSGAMTFEPAAIQEELPGTADGTGHQQDNGQTGSKKRKSREEAQVS